MKLKFLLLTIFFLASNSNCQSESQIDSDDTHEEYSMHLHEVEVDAQNEANSRPAKHYDEFFLDLVQDQQIKEQFNKMPLEALNQDERVTNLNAKISPLNSYFNQLSSLMSQGSNEKISTLSMMNPQASMMNFMNPQVAFDPFMMQQMMFQQQQPQQLTQRPVLGKSGVIANPHGTKLVRKETNNALREQRLKLLQDDSFTSNHRGLANFLYTNNAPLIQEQMIKQQAEQREQKLKEIEKVSKQMRKKQSQKRKQPDDEHDEEEDQVDEEELVNKNQRKLTSQLSRFTGMNNNRLSPSNDRAFNSNSETIIPSQPTIGGKYLGKLMDPVGGRPVFNLQAVEPTKTEAATTTTTTTTTESTTTTPKKTQSSLRNQAKARNRIISKSEEVAEDGNEEGNDDIEELTSQDGIRKNLNDLYERKNNEISNSEKRNNQNQNKNRVNNQREDHRNYENFMNQKRAQEMARQRGRFASENKSKSLLFKPKQTLKTTIEDTDAQNIEAETEKQTGFDESSYDKYLPLSAKRNIASNVNQHQNSINKLNIYDYKQFD